MTNARCIVGVPGRLAYQRAFFLHRAHDKRRRESARRRRWLRKLPADDRDAQKKALTFHLLTGETFMSSRNGREENEAEKSNGRSTMKKITTLAILSAAALMLPACNENSSTEAIKEKADDAKKAIETNAEQAKEAASKKIDEATEKAKAAAPAAAAAVDNMAEKAKDATSNAADATKNAGERGVNKVEDAAQNAVDADEECRGFAVALSDCFS